MTDGPTPSEAVRDLGLEIDRDAAAMADRVLRLARVHEKAVHHHQADDDEPAATEESKPCP